jgi:hypothetical protein
MNEEQARKLKNKLHLLTFFIVNCEEEDPLEENENEWHTDFETAISAILFVNEHGYIEEDDMHEMNNLYKKWSDRYERLGFMEKDVSEFDVEPELEEQLRDFYNSYDD